MIGNAILEINRKLTEKDWNIRNIKEIKELSLLLASNLGTILSYKNIQSLIGVKSHNTVKNYLEALEDVFLFFCVDMFDYSVKRQIYNPSKVHCIDAALSRPISFNFSRNLGHIYENLVFLELMRRNEKVFYWKSKDEEGSDSINGAEITILPLYKWLLLYSEGS